MFAFFLRLGARLAHVRLCVHVCVYNSFVSLKINKDIPDICGLRNVTICPPHMSQNVTNNHKFGVTGTNFQNNLFATFSVSIRI